MKVNLTSNLKINLKMLEPKMAANTPAKNLRYLISTVFHFVTEKRQIKLDIHNNDVSCL